MSYDIWLEVGTGGKEPATVGDSWNFTTNCAPMWRLAGADLAGFHGKKAFDCAGTLSDAIVHMERRPEKFSALDTPNGWGTYAQLLPALRRLLATFEAHPKAIVRVSR